MTDPKPIETRYAGCRFRSRLEARWAVFMDHLGIEWQYEPEGYTLPAGDRYLPDFYLPRQKQRVEVKATLLMPELGRIIQAAAALRPPDAEPHQFDPGVLILGPIPRPSMNTVHVRYATFGAHVIEQRCYFSPNTGGGFDIRTIGEQCVVPAIRDWSHISGDANADGLCNEAVTPQVDYDLALHDRVVAAYRAARSARFEHGEEG